MISVNDKRPLVSIIIPVYNGSNFMREAIDSALAQTYPNIEILVINDGSTDNTREIALSYGDKIRYLEKANGGVSTALNFGIKEMKGEYFSWLSHDDIYYPNKIQREIEVLIADGDMGKVVYSAACDLIMPERKLFRSMDFLNDLPRSITETGSLMTYLSFVSGCTLLIPRKLLIDYGGFDENYRAVQDYKLWFEMFRGKRTIYVPEYLVASRVHSMQTGRTYSKVYAEEEWLYCWMVGAFRSSDLNGSNISEWAFFCLMARRFYNNEKHCKAFKEVCNCLLKREEDLDTDTKILSLKDKLLHGTDKLYLYCIGARCKKLLWGLAMRGIAVDGVSDTNPEKWGKEILGYTCVEPKYVPKDAHVIVTKSYPGDVADELHGKGYKHVSTYDDFMADLMMTPLKKDCIEKWIRNNSFLSV